MDPLIPPMPVAPALDLATLKWVAAVLTPLVVVLAGLVRFIYSRTLFQIDARATKESLAAVAQEVVDLRRELDKLRDRQG